MITISLGETRRVGIEIKSKINQSFEITNTHFSIYDKEGNLVSQGVPTLDGNRIITLFQPSEVGKYSVKFNYRIAKEVFSAKVNVEVV